MRQTFNDVIGALQWVVQRMAISESPEQITLLVALALLSVGVAVRPVWIILRHGVTIVHEMGHVVMGWLWGRRIDGISLHTDTSGLTISAGKQHGIGVLMTFLSGYTAPPAVGLGLIWAAMNGWSGLGLSAMVLMLVAAFWLTRNLWGLLTVSVSLGLAGWVFWMGEPRVVSTVVVVTGMFLILAGLRGGFDLWAIHAQGQGEQSDATMAARHSLIPATAWVWFFGLFGFLCGFYALWTVIGT